MLMPRADRVRAQPNSLVMGFSGSGITSDLRRVIEKEKLWAKHGVNVKAIYFNSGGVMTQAIAGGNINISDSDLPAMLNLSVSGIMDIKAISVIINRLEHIFVVRKNISTPEELKGKRIAVSRIGSASDIVTRMVMRQWKVDPEKEVFILQSGNTPTRMTALVAGHVDAALISPDGIHKILTTGCCRILQDLSELPLDYARFGGAVPTSLIRTQRARFVAIFRPSLKESICSRPDPNLSTRFSKKKGSKNLRLRRISTNDWQKACANIPFRMPTAFRALWIHWSTLTRAM